MCAYRNDNPSDTTKTTPHHWSRSQYQSKGPYSSHSHTRHYRSRGPLPPREQENYQPEPSWEEDVVEEEMADGVLRLIDLPDLVGQRICTFLRQGDLLTLRLVRKATKAWVESPCILSTICVDIKRPNHLERMLRDKRTVNFTNVKIQLEKIASQNYLSSDFLVAYGERLKVLKITSASGFFRKIDVLLKCPCLEVVHISDLSLRNIPPQDLSVLGTHFKSYKDFRLEELQLTTEPDVVLLMEWISKSLKLEHLRLPQIQFENGEPKQTSSEYDCTHRDFFDRKVIEPLIRGMKLKILKILDLERLCLCMTNKDSVQRLAASCHQFGVKLLNVPFAQLDPPPLRNWEEYEKGLQAVKSLKGYQPGKVDTSKLINVEELTLSIGFSVVSDAHDVTTELALPKLQKLKISIFCMDEEVSRSIVSALLTQKRRDTVTELMTAWNLNRPSPSSFTSGLDMGRSFPNLKILELLQWGGNYEEFQNLFRGVERLEELSIRDCKGLSDEAFSGEETDISPFRKLTKLRKVCIRCYDRGVTDVSLQKAFSVLPLRSLSINFIGLSSITLRGLSFLNRLPFMSSIQYLNLQVDKINYGSAKRITDNFKNLKKCQFS